MLISHATRFALPGLLRIALLVGVAGASLTLPATSLAVVTVGEDMSITRGELAGDPCFGPGGANTFASTAVPPGRLLTSPIDGVVTRWRAWVYTDPTSVSLRVLRPADGGQFTGVAGSAPSPSFTGVGTFDSRIPTKAGDYIGIDLPCSAGIHIAVHYFLGANTVLWAPAITDGPAPLAPGFNDPNYSLMANADIEPDADGDGYGDETQDQCPGNATTQGTCPSQSAPAVPAPGAMDPVPPAIDHTSPAASASFKRICKLRRVLRRVIRAP